MIHSREEHIRNLATETDQVSVIILIANILKLIDTDTTVGEPAK